MSEHDKIADELSQLILSMPDTKLLKDSDKHACATIQTLNGNNERSHDQENLAGVCQYYLHDITLRTMSHNFVKLN